jgi:hypothetical protein
MGVVEGFILIKIFPGLLMHGTPGKLPLLAGAVLANYVLGAMFWGFLYPTFLSPLRHLHGPKVRYTRTR